jgi:hypothetical protein
LPRIVHDDMPMLQVQSSLVGSYILALPIDGSTCLGSTETKALIATSIVDVSVLMETILSRTSLLLL